MIIKTVQEVVRERIRECANATLERFRASIRPIYGATPDGRPRHLGSAILLNLPEGYFLLTAAHNLEWNRTTTLYLGVNITEMLTFDATATTASNGVRLDDRFDFAIARLPDKLVAELGSSSFVTETAISRPVANTVGRTYTCLGFPNSKNRTPPRFKTSMRPVLASYTSNGVPLDRLGTRAAADFHILVDFNFKFSRDENGIRVNSIKPNGFSGGAVFDVGRISDPAALAADCDPGLIALFTEAHRGPRVIMATRIAPALEELRKQGAL